MPNAEEQALQKLGISLIDAQAAPDAYADLLRVARRLRESHRRAIGLLPASSRVAVPPVAIQLAAVMADVCTGSIALVNANGRWPALASLASDVDVQAGGIVQVTLREGVIAFSRPELPDARIDVDWLQDTLDTQARGFVHVLVDLTGFTGMGEHARAFDIVDGVLVVARTGTTSERELLACQADIPRARLLGVLLSG